MRRPWQTWMLFAACLALAAVALAWVTRSALWLDRAEMESRLQAAREEMAGLALWRMDSYLSSFIAREAARPYFAYDSFYLAWGPSGSYGAEGTGGGRLLPSPLLMSTPKHVLLHFQFHPDGRVTSPQVPVGRRREMAVDGYIPREEIEARERLLALLLDGASRPVLLAEIPAPDEDPFLGDWTPLAMRSGGDAAWHPSLSRAEWRSRLRYSKMAKASQARANTLLFSQQIRSDRNLVEDEGSRPVLEEGLMTPVWIGEHLVLARRVRVEEADYIQGSWLDWEGLRRHLLSGIKDLLPGADLVPASGDGGGEGGHMLASLPVRLEPGFVASPLGPYPSYIRLALAIAWIGLVLAAGAAALLLFGAISLGERRAAFVSAVTHELRTPLTTLRMYAEMLAGGMVRDEEKMQEYLNTLNAEADRLGHLVENVLAYAGIEEGGSPALPEDLRVGEMVARAGNRLSDRAAQAGMELDVSVPAEIAALGLHTDVSAVEQILLNLVDNACKYAAGAGDRRIHLEAHTGEHRLLLTVRDHGPGLKAEAERRLFRPFSRPRERAAGTAPGIGLGLALSRRLARQMGGDLRLGPQACGGASFVLEIPLA